jgi:hypothetical protein
VQVQCFLWAIFRSWVRYSQKCISQKCAFHFQKNWSFHTTSSPCMKAQANTSIVSKYWIPGALQTINSYKNCVRNDYRPVTLVMYLWGYLAWKVGTRRGIELDGLLVCPTFTVLNNRESCIEGWVNRKIQYLAKQSFFAVKYKGYLLFLSCKLAPSFASWCCSFLAAKPSDKFVLVRDWVTLWVAVLCTWSYSCMGGALGTSDNPSCT